MLSDRAMGASDVSQSIGVGMIGCGTVGGGVVTLLKRQAALYETRLGRPIELRRVLVRDVSRGDRHADVDPALLTDDADAFFNTPDMQIVLEVAGGTGVIGRHVRRAIEAGKHVVTANKALLAAEGPDLFKLADRCNVAVAFEASCGGGIPIVTALKFGLMANRIDALFGILNGTCNYILTQMTRHGTSYDVALSDAQAKGFAEADPTLDVSGRDAAQKLAILASIAFGVRVEEDQVACVGIDELELSDIRSAEELGYELKLLAIAQRRDDGSLSLRTEPCFIDADEPLAQVHGSFNALSVFGNATGHTMYLGRGAGQMPTASAVVSDLINVASGWYGHAFGSLYLWPDTHQPAQVEPHDQLHCKFYVRLNAIDEPGTLAKVTSALGDAGISLSAVLQREVRTGQAVPLMIVTHAARYGALRESLAKIEQLQVIDGKPSCIRIVDLPAG